MPIPDTLGRLTPVDLRSTWQTEAAEFTPWLAREANLALLGDTLGLDLELTSQETSVGPFRADLVCRETGSNSVVLIENQLERTDHTHLGQILTYAAGLQAVTIVWIAARFTDEHRATLEWLNEVTADNIEFFGLEVELWRIGDSAVAPKFNIVAKPNDWTKGGRGGGDADGLTGAPALQLAYWRAFKDYVAAQEIPLRLPRPVAGCWLSVSIGTSRASVDALVNTQKKRITVRLLIHPDPIRLPIFDTLLAGKPAIEDAIGAALEWERLPERKYSYITLRRPDTDPANQATWPEQFAWFAATIPRFRDTFGPRIKAMEFPPTEG